MRQSAEAKEGADLAAYWMRWWWSLTVEIGSKGRKDGRPEPLKAVARRLSAKRWREIRAYPLEHYAKHRLSPEELARVRPGASIVTMRAAYRVGAMLGPLVTMVVGRHEGQRRWYERMRAGMWTDEPMKPMPVEWRIDLAPVSGAIVGRLQTYRGELSITLVPDVETALCLAIGQDIAQHAGLFRQCRLPRCGRPFFRVGSQHWCSNKCGNYFRVTNKRIREQNERRRANGQPEKPELQMLDVGEPDPGASRLIAAIIKMLDAPRAERASVVKETRGLGQLFDPV